MTNDRRIGVRLANVVLGILPGTAFPMFGRTATQDTGHDDQVEDPTPARPARAERPRSTVELSIGGQRDFADAGGTSGEGYGQSHAAPRTPLESPCRAFTNRVRTVSENTNGDHSAGTLA